MNFLRKLPKFTETDLAVSDKNNIFQSDSSIIDFFQKKNYLIKFINGENCKNKLNLLDQFSKALNFPDYFGKNWDAFDEVMGDLNWLNMEEFGGILICISNPQFLLSDEPDEINTFLDIIKSAILDVATDEFYRKSFNMRIVFIDNA
jgi:hypothetical protein